jgi:hypothetical protein
MESLLRLKRTTALKMHLRETSPIKITELRRRQELSLGTLGLFPGPLEPNAPLGPALQVDVLDLQGGHLRDPQASPMTIYA